MKRIDALDAEGYDFLLEAIVCFRTDFGKFDFVLLLVNILMMVV